MYRAMRRVVPGSGVPVGGTTNGAPRSLGPAPGDHACDQPLAGARLRATQKALHMGKAREDTPHPRCPPLRPYPAASASIPSCSRSSAHSNREKRFGRRRDVLGVSVLKANTVQGGTRAATTRVVYAGV